jgi:hypothetical protein
MLISLKVVNMAVVFLAISSRSAMRARSRVIGTRCSNRPSASGARAAGAAGAATGAGQPARQPARAVGGELPDLAALR